MAFLCPDTEDGKKTSFRLTDVLSGGEISVGDEVEYIVIQSRPNSKPIATNVRKIRLSDYHNIDIAVIVSWVPRMVVTLIILPVLSNCKHKIPLHQLYRTLARLNIALLWSLFSCQPIKYLCALYFISFMR